MKRWWWAWLGVAWLSACAQVPAPPAASAAAVSVGAEPARSSALQVHWQVAPDVGLSDLDRAELEQVLAARLEGVLSARPQRTLALRATITRVDVVHPGLNVALTVLLLGPLERGGAAVDIEAIDPVSGQRVAHLVRGYYAPLAEWRLRYDRLGSAKWALQQAAEDFAQTLTSLR